MSVTMLYLSLEHQINASSRMAFAKRVWNWKQNATSCTLSVWAILSFASVSIAYAKSICCTPQPIAIFSSVDLYQNSWISTTGRFNLARAEYSHAGRPLVIVEQLTFLLAIHKFSFCNFGKCKSGSIIVSRGQSCRPLHVCCHSAKTLSRHKLESTVKCCSFAASLALDTAWIASSLDLIGMISL